MAVSTWMLTSQSNSSATQITSSALCLSEFHQETAPELINPKLQPKTYPLCYDGFTLLYSGISKTPLWVAEKLTAYRLNIRVKREDNFHEELRIPLSDRALLTDYRGSSYDRGHMAPSADMSSRSSQNDSFSLANIVPQNPINNQNTWREIEEATRAMVSKYQADAYIITGPAYLDQSVQYIKKDRNVLVPSHVYKAVFFPELGIASAYLSRNNTSKSAEILSICALENKLGINLFPQMEDQNKKLIFQLPMRANQVKNHQKPRLISSDQKSECFSLPESSQLKNTRETFIIGYDYSKESVVNMQSIREKVPKIPNQERLNINQWLLHIIQWLKENDQRDENR